MTASVDDAVRRSRVAWLDDARVYEKIFPYFQQANWSAGWLFHFQALERLQFTAYAVGERYGWHVDQTPRPYGSEYGAYAGLYRKLSMTVQLSSPSDYDGGILQIERGLPGEADRIRAVEEMRPRGSVVVFPSFLPHRITAVVRGERLALVTWACGRPYL
ncbi:MAG: 2OG-Fe(II) oxygenase [Myxococcota bacterium]